MSTTDTKLTTKEKRTAAIRKRIDERLTLNQQKAAEKQQGIEEQEARREIERLEKDRRAQVWNNFSEYEKSDRRNCGCNKCMTY